MADLNNWQLLSAGAEGYREQPLTCELERLVHHWNWVHEDSSGYLGGGGECQAYPRSEKSRFCGAVLF